MTTTSTTRIASAGHILRHWRQHRRRSQLQLALEAQISTKHLSFLETGRSLPSREMLLKLARCLELPLRERNALLHAAGFAAAFKERPLGDPALAAARAAVELVLRGHEPYPAIAIDRHWTLVAANSAAPQLMTGASAALLQPPVNVLRLSLHPEGLAPRIVNLAQWRAHIFERLRAQIAATADAELETLLEELKQYGDPGVQQALPDYGGVMVPLEFSTPQGVLSFVSTTTIFGTPLDITLSELAIESFFPANDETAAALRRAAASRPLDQDSAALPGE